MPVGVPLPLVVVGVDVLEPAVGCEDVGFAVAVDVGDSDAVAVFIFAADVMDAGFWAGEVDPEDAGVVVVGEGDVGFAVAVDVGEGSALGVEAVSDEVLLPEGAGGRGFAGVFVPPEAVGDPSGGDDVGVAVVVDVDGPFAAVGDEFGVGAYGAVLVALPVAAVGAGVFVPVGSAEEVEEAVVVHVEGGDGFGVVGAEAVDEEGWVGCAVGAGAGSGFAEFGGVGGVLGVGRDCGESEEDEGGEFEGIFHLASFDIMGAREKPQVLRLNNSQRRELLRSG